MSRKTLTGKVVSDRMEKTAVVAVARFFRHTRYAKGVRRSKKYLVQNAVGAKVGDRVTIEESRPISKTKHFRITGTVTKKV